MFTSPVFSTFRTSILCVLCCLALRSNAQTNSQYILLFSARGPAWYPYSFTGHAFVSFIEQNAQGDLVATRTLGFYPDHDAGLLRLLFGALPASVEEGFVHNKRRTSLLQVAFTVDSASWQRAYEKAMQWNQYPYRLFGNNCVAFAANIAEEAGLAVPSAKILGHLPRYPRKWLRLLEKRNTASMIIFEVPCCEDEKKPVASEITAMHPLSGSYTHHGQLSLDPARETFYDLSFSLYSAPADVSGFRKMP